MPNGLVDILGEFQKKDLIILVISNPIKFWLKVAFLFESIIIIKIIFHSMDKQHLQKYIDDSLALNGHQ